MREDDGRGRKVAVVSDVLLNGPADVLSLLAPRDFGAMQLPPAELPEAAAALWLENLLDQARELRAHGYGVVGLLAPGEPAGDAVRALGVPVLEAGDAARVEAFLAEHG